MSPFVDRRAMLAKLYKDPSLATAGDKIRQPNQVSVSRKAELPPTSLSRYALHILENFPVNQEGSQQEPTRVQRTGSFAPSTLPSNFLAGVTTTSTKPLTSSFAHLSHIPPAMSPLFQSTDPLAPLYTAAQHSLHSFQKQPMEGADMDVSEHEVICGFEELAYKLDMYVQRDLSPTTVEMLTQLAQELAASYKIYMDQIRGKYARYFMHDTPLPYVVNATVPILREKFPVSPQALARQAKNRIGSYDRSGKQAMELATRTQRSIHESLEKLNLPVLSARQRPRFTSGALYPSLHRISPTLDVTGGESPINPPPKDTPLQDPISHELSELASERVFVEANDFSGLSHSVLLGNQLQYKSSSKDPQTFITQSEDLEPRIGFHPLLPHPKSIPTATTTVEQNVEKRTPSAPRKAKKTIPEPSASDEWITVEQAPFVEPLGHDRFFFAPTLKPRHENDTSSRLMTPSHVISPGDTRQMLRPSPTATSRDFLREEVRKAMNPEFQDMYADFVRTLQADITKRLKELERALHHRVRETLFTRRQELAQLQANVSSNKHELLLKMQRLQEAIQLATMTQKKGSKNLDQKVQLSLLKCGIHEQIPQIQQGLIKEIQAAYCALSRCVGIWISTGYEQCVSISCPGLTGDGRRFVLFPCGDSICSQCLTTNPEACPICLQAYDEAVEVRASMPFNGPRETLPTQAIGDVCTRIREMLVLALELNSVEIQGYADAEKEFSTRNTRSGGLDWRRPL
ncbi:hypothetical protein GMRT_14958 [Giardia muris]|uniref:RING-type domain-containing protein n=1 Tax=Giardia muris TaxID=5742 RepID=A0A4Z1T9I7_GIAMU|nr:hypothetical protein GMRT_14958 [Giardia muris]|eukprot:TNJ29191.1 hypothetical protein GMRT_14958 [Giardia muris]